MAVDWNIVDEIRLFRWVSEFKPIGIHRHFHMFCILERMNNPDKYPVITLQKESYHRPPKLFTSKDIWLKLKQYYNLDEANNIENEFMINQNNNEKSEKSNSREQLFIDELKLIENDSQFSDTKLLQNGYRLMTETKDFSLPWDEYGDLILSKVTKKKNSVANKENNINKDGESRIKFIKNVGGTIIEDNKNSIKYNNIQAQNQIIIEQKDALTNGNRDNAMTEDKKYKVIEKYDNPNESIKTDEDISTNKAQNQNNNLQTGHIESTKKEVERIEKTDKNENYKNMVTQTHTENKPIGDVKDTGTIEKHRDPSFDANDQYFAVESIKIVDKIENHEKIGSQTETKAELDREIENIDKQEDLPTDTTTDELEDIQINKKADLRKEEEKPEFTKQENEEAKENIQEESNKAINHTANEKDIQIGESEEVKKEDIPDKESQKEDNTEPVQQIQNKQLEYVKEEEKAVFDKEEVEKAIEIREPQTESETSSENHDNLLRGNQEEKKKETEVDTEAVIKNPDSRELSSKEGEELKKEDKESAKDDNEEKKENEKSIDKQSNNNIQLEKEYEKQEHEIPQRHRRKRVYPRAHRISSRLRRKAYGNETNNESNVEPVKLLDYQSVKEKKTVENEKTNLKHTLNTEQDTTIDNEPLAKRTRHSSHAKTIRIEDGENQQNGGETTSSTSSSKRGRRKNSNRTLEPTRFSTRLRNRK